MFNLCVSLNQLFTNAFSAIISIVSLRGTLVNLDSVVRKVLPKEIAGSVCQKDSRLPHLYGLPKTHKEKLSMRPILSATGNYNYALANWLVEKLKPLSVNRYTISDTFAFAEESQNLTVDENDILVSYDVTSLFANVPLSLT